MSDYIEIKRKTTETDIKLEFCINGKGNAEINTGTGFLDHMLTLFTVHGFFDMKLGAKGDTHIDYHHTVEDIGICMGRAILQSYAGMKGMARYGAAVIPMDETLAEVHVDLSNRPYLVFNVPFRKEKVGDFDTELFEEFFRAVAVNAGITLHVNVRYGDNTHHMIEAVFKAFGRALDNASKIDPRVTGVLSSKGSI